MSANVKRVIVLTLAAVLLFMLPGLSCTGVTGQETTVDPSPSSPAVMDPVPSVSDISISKDKTFPPADTWVPSDELDGSGWKLVSPDGNPVTDGSYISLYFRNGEVWGSDNGLIYSAKYSVQPSDIIAFSEISALDSNRQPAESYLKFIKDAAVYRLKDNHLEIDKADHTGILFEKLPEYTADPDNLIGTWWRLASIDNNPVEYGLNITLDFDSANRASGQAGCFAYTLSYEANGDDIRWGINSRKIDELPRSLETRALQYTDTIIWAANYHLFEDKLEIFTAKGDTLVFQLQTMHNHPAPEKVEVFGDNIFDPAGLAFDSQGNLYVANNRIITKISPEGKRTEISLGADTIPSRLACDAEDNVYITGCLISDRRVTGYRMWRLKPDGHFNSLVDLDAYASDLVVAPQGRIYVIVGGVQKIGGTELLGFGPNGDLESSYWYPAMNSVTLDSSGRLFVGGANGVFQVNLDGEPLETYISRENMPVFSSTMRFDRNGWLYIDSDDDIYIASPGGEVQLFASETGIYETSMAFGPDNCLYVGNFESPSRTAILRITPGDSGSSGEDS